jgi:hypothetical protein
MCIYVESSLLNIYSFTHVKGTEIMSTVPYRIPQLVKRVFIKNFDLIFLLTTYCTILTGSHCLFLFEVYLTTL